MRKMLLNGEDSKPNDSLEPTDVLVEGWDGVTDDGYGFGDKLEEV